MTDWKGHLKIGVPLNFIFLIISISILSGLHRMPYFDLKGGLFLLFITLLSPLFIDIDHPSSKITYWGTGLALILLLYAYFENNSEIQLIGLIILGSVFFLSRFFKHRGFIHSISFSVLLGLMFYYFYRDYFIASYLCFGTWTHLVGDKIPWKIK